jgi:hypothetical protein
VRAVGPDRVVTAFALQVDQHRVGHAAGTWT